MHDYTTLSVTPEVAEEIRERRDSRGPGISTSAVLEELLQERGE